MEAMALVAVLAEGVVVDAAVSAEAAREVGDPAAVGSCRVLPLHIACSFHEKPENHSDFSDRSGDIPVGTGIRPTAQQPAAARAGKRFRERDSRDTGT